MSDDTLRALAEAAGIAPGYRDAFGQDHLIAPPTLRAVLAAIGLPAGDDAAMRDSFARLRRGPTHLPLPPLVTGDAGAPIALAAAPGRFRLTLEDGSVVEGTAEAFQGGTILPPIALAGYHRLLLGDQAVTLAVAPHSCYAIAEAAPGPDPWGLAVQLYALRRAGDGGIGDFAGLADFVHAAGASGAAAVAISPAHAQFSADPDRFSPYAPSSRTAFNVLHAATEGILPAGAAPDSEAEAAEHRRLESLPLVDWPAASRARLAHLRRVYDVFAATSGTTPHREFAAFRASPHGVAVAAHARFEALHAHFYGADYRHWNWRTWPEAYRDPANPAVAAFAVAHATEVDFHTFLQFLAERGLAQAQAAAKSSGMAIGLISDLAVGTDGGGSHAWSRQDETLLGLSIGAPPDLLSLEGQDWGLAAFSPLGLRRNGFTAFLEMLRAALRHAGGVRIDHVMGLARLWVLPEGARATEGAYLHFPLEDLMRLVALESRRHRAIVLGEDLGTLPSGFQDQLIRRGILGLRVLWFERDGPDFKPPGSWSRGAVGMTSTHDIATVAGWWTGRDLGWRRQLGRLGDEAGVWYAYEDRERDRDRLWGALHASGATQAVRPPGDQPAAVVDAAIAHVGRSACEMVLLPVEDALGEPEQPNLPGTMHEHPNWRRRFAAPADALLDDPEVTARLAALTNARTRS